MGRYFLNFVLVTTLVVETAAYAEPSKSTVGFAKACSRLLTKVVTFGYWGPPNYLNDLQMEFISWSGNPFSSHRRGEGVSSWGETQFDDYSIQLRIMIRYIPGRDHTPVTPGVDEKIRKLFPAVSTEIMETGTYYIWIRRDKFADDASFKQEKRRLIDLLINQSYEEFIRPGLTRPQR